ncbi:MAG: hypothetical protein EA378_09855 [Phycisphaerales bacterium]|nr:MAG: hypothetical protein EA378_09855 [Phycisphaerales bacterium]
MGQTTTRHRRPARPLLRRSARAFRPRLLLASVVAVAMVALTPHAALAQANELPAEVVTTTRLTGEQEQAVRAFARQQAEELGSADAEIRRRARGRLLRPLATPNASVSFRLAYSGALMPELDRLARQSEIEIRLNAIRVAGELATQDSSDLILRALDADATEVRIMGSYALRRTFESLATQPPALAEGRVRSLLDRAAAMVEREPDPLAFDSAVRTLAAAGRIARPNLNLRNDAYRRLAESVSERIRANPIPRDALGVMRTGEALLDVLRSVESLDTRAAIAAGGFAGDALAMVRDALASDAALPASDRERLVSLAQIVEAVVFFARTVADPSQTPEPTNHATSLRDHGDLDRFNAGLERDLIGANGALTRRPFGFNADRFEQR